jgi:hypothetical protein
VLPLAFSTCVLAGSGKPDGPASAARVLTRDQMICLFPSPLQKAGELPVGGDIPSPAKQQ